MPKQQPKLEWRGDKVIASLTGTSLDNLRFAAIFLKGAIKEKLTGNRTGRVYRVPGTKTLYTASAPGEPPASRTGTLRNAITFRVNKAKMEAFVGPRLLGEDPKKQYPVWLEFGTKKMSPRPFMAPALEENKDTIVKIMKQGWDE